MSVEQPALEIKNLGKRYPGVVALDGVDLDLRRGEVYALLGENGAGKSTLLKILSGDQSADEGSIQLAGRPYVPASPRDAQEHGIVTVYQEFSLIPELTVAENILLAREPGRFGLVNWRSLKEQAAVFCEMVGLSRLPTEIVSNLSVAEQQLVEIGRAMSMKADILIMDEPTATLSEHEVERLFDLVKKLRGQGVTIVFVTHRLNEVFRICDRYTVLRDGRKVASGAVADITTDGLITAMVGRDAGDVFPRRSGATAGETRVRIRGLSYEPQATDTTAIHIRDIDLDIAAGEIVGVAGLVGAGRTQLARCLFGADPITAGSIEVDGKAVNLNSPLAAIEHGLALVPEDRKAQGLFLDLPVRSNFSIAAMGAFTRAMGALDLSKEDSLFSVYRDRFRIKMSDPRQAVSGLSGGNQQKVIMARWIAIEPRVLIVDEPTRGIDVGAKAEIYQLLYELAESGMAILVISSELPELVAISDRIVVMKEGRLVGHVQGEDINESRVGELMFASTTEH